MKRKDQPIKFKTLRNIHLYLGCVFAPLLIFLVITGCIQMFDLHHSRKDGSYHAPAVLRSLADVHQHQRWPDFQNKRPPSDGFRFFVLSMSLGLLVMVLLGVVMAVQSVSPVMVWGCLLAGIILPVLLLRLFSGQ